MIDMDPGTIYVDSRVGSKELEHLLGRGKKGHHPGHGIKTKLATLDSADFAFTCGHTEPNPMCSGHGCKIGVERKTISDLIGSLMSNRLVGHQIPQMLEDYTMVWILVEGLWRPGVGGGVEVSRHIGGLGSAWGPAHGRLTYAALSSWLVRFDVLGGGKLKRWRTASATESAAFIASLFHWWQKEWGKHQLDVVQKMVQPSRALMHKPTQMERVVMSFDGVGAKSTKAVCTFFDSIFAVMTASPKQLQKSGLGQKTSYGVWETIRRRVR